MNARAQQVFGWAVGVTFVACACALMVGVTVHVVRWLV